MANLVKRAASSLLDKLSHPAQVLAVRAWGPRTLYELDLHLPAEDLTKWVTIPRLKCRVGEFDFRDYTPARWDAARRVCTLYIEAGHEGAGSRWVRQLRPGDAVAYRSAHAEKLPAGPGRVLALGDGSALGHLLALRQLLSHPANSLDAGVVFPAGYQWPGQLPAQYPGLTLRTAADVAADLDQWLAAQPISQYTAIYLAGNMDLVAHLRRQLKAHPALAARLYVTGFWH